MNRQAVSVDHYLHAEQEEEEKIENELKNVTTTQASFHACSSVS